MLKHQCHAMVGAKFVRVSLAVVGGVMIGMLSATPLWAASPSPKSPVVDAQGELVVATALVDVETVAPGGEFTLGVRLKIAPHYHVYWRNPGETGDATKITVSGPAGFSFGDVQWPLPTRFNTEAGISYGYENEVLLLIPVTVAKSAAAGSAAIDVQTSWLSCKDICIEGEAKLQAKVTIGQATRPANAELFAAWRDKLPVYGMESPEGKPLVTVEQGAAADGQPGATLRLQWDGAPSKVEWFPVSTRAVAIEDVVVAHDKTTTRITYKPTVYKPADVPGGAMQSVLVFEDGDGKRMGFFVPFKVAIPGK